MEDEARSVDKNKENKNEIIFITGNFYKAEEAGRILKNHGISMVSKDIEIDEIQSNDLNKIVKRKALDAFKQVGKPLFVEDTAVYLKSLNGYPGPYIKHLMEVLGNQGIIDLLKDRDRSCFAITIIAFHDSNGEIHTFEGKVEGKISDYIGKGSNFGWDVIFIPDGYDKTYSELGAEEKDRISARAKAVNEFAEWLSRLDSQ